MFHILKNGEKVWKGETFEGAARQAESIAKEPDADLIEMRFGSNPWAHWYKFHDAPGWHRIIANRGQENVAVVKVAI